MGDVAFSDIGKACQVAQRRADPSAPAIGANSAKIDKERLAPQGAGALEWGVGQFRTAELDSEEIIRERHKSIRRSTGIEKGS